MIVLLPPFPCSRVCIAGAVNLIERSHEALQHGGGAGGGVASVRSMDPMNMLRSVARQQQQQQGEGDNSQTTAPEANRLFSQHDVERLFWASWDSFLVKNVQRGIQQVIAAYTSA